MSKRYGLCFWLLLSMSFEARATECVILLHGLARSSASMNTLERSLIADHYKVVNYDYPSTQEEIAPLANDAIPSALEQCDKADSVHFITHSMGAILVRQFLHHKTIANLGHVIMLGPPNQGSEVVDKLRDVPGFQALNGPAGLQLGTAQDSLPNRLGAVNYSVGVIAGNQSINLVLSTLIPGPDDGKVAIEKTKVEGMSDHITLATSHPFMMKNEGVIEQAKYFLRHGSFLHNEQAAPTTQ